MNDVSFTLSRNADKIYIGIDGVVLVMIVKDNQELYKQLTTSTLTSDMLQQVAAKAGL